MAHGQGFWVPTNKIGLYANSLSKQTYDTDVPTLLNEVKALKERVKRRDVEIAGLKSKINKLERLIAPIRKFH